LAKNESEEGQTTFKKPAISLYATVSRLLFYLVRLKNNLFTILRFSSIFFCQKNVVRSSNIPCPNLSFYFAKEIVLFQKKFNLDLYIPKADKYVLVLNYYSNANGTQTLLFNIGDEVLATTVLYNCEYRYVRNFVGTMKQMLKIS
jgi:hypothetical protein